jgi:hypothetical protein
MAIRLAAPTCPPSDPMINKRMVKFSSSNCTSYIRASSLRVN